MLVLTRGLKQQVVIDGGLVTVTVLEVSGNRVRLGIDAPKDVPVRRRELDISGQRQAGISFIPIES
jgi:carbon storage regulator